MRDAYGSILAECGEGAWHLTDQPERSVVMTESYSYSNSGRALDRFRKDHFSFIADEERFVYGDGGWHTAPVARDSREPELTLLNGIDPIRDGSLEPEQRELISRAHRGFLRFRAQP